MIIFQVITDLIKTMPSFRFSVVSLLGCTLGLSLLAGCGSEAPKEPVKPVVKKPKDPPKQPVKVEPKKPDPAEVWAELMEKAEAALAEEKLEEVSSFLGELGKVYEAPQEPSEEAQTQLADLAQRLDSLKKTAAASKRAAQLASAQELMAVGKFAEATRQLDSVLASSPTPEQTKTAGEIANEIERQREARRRLQTWMDLLGSSSKTEVRSAQSQLAKDPATAISMLVESVQEADNPVLVTNSLELMRRLRRPLIALPAMVGVLTRVEQEKNWPDAVKQIIRIKQPGAGAPLLDLVLASENSEQRIAALTVLAQVVDPPESTLVALLPLINQDGPELKYALEAAYHAVDVYSQYDWIARRSLDFPITAEQEELLAGLPVRLNKLIEAGASSGAPDAAGYAAKVLSVALRLTSAEPFEGLKVASSSAESDDGPADAVIDGVWNSIELPTMWRHPIESRSSIVLDLGETKTVTGVKIWNFNGEGGSLRGWKSADVYVSDNPRALEPNTSGIVPMAPGAADTPDYSTVIPVGFVRGRYVKIQATEFWQKMTFTGLSEVQVLGF